MVFLWYVGNAQSSGLVPSLLGLWTMADVLAFILYAVFWELLLVGIPVIVAAAAAWQWWKRLPAEETQECRFRGRSRSAGGGGGVSLLFFIAFCIKVLLDGKWNVPVSTFTLNYVVGSLVTILMWGLAVFGIPAAIVLFWWLYHATKTP